MFSLANRLTFFDMACIFIGIIGKVMKNSWEKLASKGEALYQKEFSKKLPPHAKGKFAAIDVESKDFYIGHTLLEAFQKARKKHPTHKFHFVRVGFPAAVSFKHRTRP